MKGFCALMKDFQDQRLNPKKWERRNQQNEDSMWRRVRPLKWCDIGLIVEQAWDYFSDTLGHSIRAQMPSKVKEETTMW